MEEELIAEEPAVREEQYASDAWMVRYRLKEKEARMAKYQPFIDKIAEYCKGKVLFGKTIKLDLDDYDSVNNITQLRIKINGTTIYHTVHKNFDLSCGHRQFTGFITNEFTTLLMNSFKKKYRDTCLKDIYTIIFEFIKTECRCEFIIASNNSLDNKSVMNNMFEEMARWKTDWLVNPNSNNTICIFIL